MMFPRGASASRACPRPRLCRCRQQGGMRSQTQIRRAAPPGVESRAIESRRTDVLSLDRLAAVFALGYVGLFAGLIMFTAEGPDPTLPPAEEMARAVSEVGPSERRLSSSSRAAWRSLASQPASP